MPAPLHHYFFVQFSLLKHHTFLSLLQDPSVLWLPFPHHPNDVAHGFLLSYRIHLRSRPRRRQKSQHVDERLHATCNAHWNAICSFFMAF